MLKKFIINSLIVIILTGIVCETFRAIVAPKIRNTNEYTAASIDKETHLPQMPSGKIILIGGSNLAFSVDSKKIADSLKRPVINMALHAGLGLRFMLEEVKPHLKPNDVVLLSTEYYLRNAPDQKLLAQLIDLNPTAKSFALKSPNEYIRYYFADLQRCLSGLYFKSNIAADSNDIYIRKNFSKEGDMVGHLGKKGEINPTSYAFISPQYYGEEIITLNEFINYAKQRNVRVFYSFPCYAKFSYEFSKDGINQFANQLKEGLQCPIINEPTSLVFPREYFYDTIYHLNQEGREVRSQKTIEMLKKVL